MCNLISLKGIHLALRHRGPPLHTALPLPRLELSGSFVLTWTQKLHAINLEDIFAMC